MPKGAAATEERVSFTLAGALAGARRCVPVAVSGCAIGLVFGTLAGQTGLGAGEAALMSALVFSGAAQFLVLGLWASPLPVAAIALTTLVVGLRHLLMGAALGPVFSKLPRPKAYGSVFVMADENWALTMGEFAKGRRDAAFLIGGGLLMLLVWTGSTFVGCAFGGAVEDPSRWGLDFAFTAVFLALISGMWKGSSHAPLDGGGGGGRGGAPLAARTVVHPARRPGGEFRGGGAAWALIVAPCWR